MAISSGVRPSTASISVSGQTFIISHGHVLLSATRQSSMFSATLPMSEGAALPTFANLRKIQASISVTDGSASATLIDGDIDQVDSDMIGRSIMVHGRDRSSKLHENKSAEKWSNKKTTDIVKELAERAGLEAKIDSSILKAGRLVSDDWAKLTDGISFASVIHKLAELEGARWFVKGKTLYFLSKDNPSGIYTIHYQPPVGSYIVSDAVRLNITYNTQAAKAVEVEVKSWHSSKRKLLEHKTTIQGADGKSTYTYHLPTLTDDHVSAYSKAKADEVARHEYHVSAQCVGDPMIDIAMPLQLTGTQYFDQEYVIDEIEHAIGMSGHSMTIRASSKKQGREAE